MERKTIRMPAGLLEKWLTALRSGKYNQAQQCLTDHQGGYCCLGLLELVAGESPDEFYDNGDELPPLDWLKRHGITFLGDDGKPYSSPFLRGAAPALNYAHKANDAGLSFSVIADLIEANAKPSP